MKNLSEFFVPLRPVRMLVAVLLVVALTLTIALPAFAAKSKPNEGTVQLDEITRRSEATADTPAMEMNPPDKSPEGGLNEVQGTADRDKMFSDRETKLPVMKQIQKTLQK